MRTIRIGVFETNSSSTHSLTMCTKEQYEKWQAGEIWLNDSYRNKGKKFITKDEGNEIIKERLGDVDEDDLPEALRDEDIYRTPQEYLQDDDYEAFHKEYKTPGGETVIAIGYYGFNG